MNNQELSSLNQQSSWSELLPEIIHHVLSFIPSTREAAKTCLISKCWLHAWHSWSFRLLIFINREERADSYRKTQPFHKFVDHTMSRFDTRKNIQKFVFDVPELTFIDNESLDKWINIAIDNNVQEMALSKISCSKFLKRVLNNGSLRSLNLNFSTIPDDDQEVGQEVINLPNVETLTLSMRVFNAAFLDRFLKGSPLLENLTLIVSGDQDLEIKITGCDHLKTVDLTLHGLKSVHIDSPNLETLRLRCNTILIGSVDKCASSKLKHLDLESVTLDTKWFEGFVSQFIYLETLKLKFEKSYLPTFVITHPSIKNMVLDRGTSTTEPLVIIDMLKLSYFRYLGSLSHYYENSGVMVYPPCDFMAHLRLILNCDLFDWLGKLSQTISLYSNLTSLSLVHNCGKEHKIGNCRWEDASYSSVDLSAAIRCLLRNNHRPATPVEIGLLQLTIVDSSDLELLFTTLKELLRGLFLICHPAILTIELASGTTDHYSEITRKELKLLDEHAIKYCVECWEYPLKEVKIKEDDGFIQENNISFMLKWYMV